MNDRRQKFWWSLQGPFQAMPEQLFARVVATACSFWSKCCGVRFEKVSNGEQPHLIFMQGSLYPPPTELGYCTGNQGTAQRIIVLFVSGLWAFGRAAPGQFDAVRIVAHEVGHAILGDSHLPSGNLMAAGYNLMSRVPMQDDIVLAQSKYGPPDFACEVA